MTKSEWYANHRLIRVMTPKTYLSVKDSVAILKEIYDTHLSLSDRAKLDLINRYDSQVSSRLKRERDQLIIKGKLQAKTLWHDLIYKDNPFLKLIPKDSGFSGKYVPIPLIYGKKD